MQFHDFYIHYPTSIIQSPCHLNNIFHRDLKPENLLLDTKDWDANLKVIDFSSSQQFKFSKKMQTKVGSPYYIAPEILNT